jgi:competence protein ComEC
MADLAARASIFDGRLQTPARLRAGVERLLEAERDQLVLWLPVCLGAGVATWFGLDSARAWLSVMALALALAALALACWRGGRAGVAVASGALAITAGVALAWWRAEQVRAPVLARPAIVRIEAQVERIDRLAARELVRLRLRTARVIEAPVPVPPVVRVNVAEADAPAGLARGAQVRLRARLMPPPGPAVPGAYDFARVAWFAGIGATGRAFAPVEVLAPGQAEATRARLTRHIQAQAPGSAGGIAAALVTGDTGAIGEPDAEAMRRAGLAHLLSVSGLHLTAVVGITMMVVLRVLALSPWLALRLRLPLVAAGAAALTAVGYTMLAGSEVPTVRSCIAALLVLGAMAAGREAITLRLVAVGALVVLVLWPESLVGPSFQLSFAAITAIVALHEAPFVRRCFERREEGQVARLARAGGSLLLTGLVVEAALMPVAVYHFHKAGLYGALANIVAIPFTTFVIMPLEALALALDAIGFGWPVWWLVERGLALLLWLAHRVATAPGAVTALPAMPGGAFALIVAGGLWLALWRTRWRVAGLLPILVGASWALATPAPDLLVTGDGRHLAIRTGGTMALLRDRAGDYVRDMLAENGGLDGEPGWLAERPEARCSRDLCMVMPEESGRRWTILATRSAYLVPAGELVRACEKADIVVSERRLPKRCRPRWLRLDRPVLARSGGVAVTLSTGTVRTALSSEDAHPWRVAAARSAEADDQFRRNRWPRDRKRRSDPEPDRFNRSDGAVR